MTIKKGTLTQFTQAETLAARNEADNFDFDAAFIDWKSQNITTVNQREIAGVFFIAGIALGKRLILEQIEQPTTRPTVTNETGNNELCGISGCDCKL